MKASEAILKADTLRPNTLDTEQKARWIYELDYEVAEMMGEEIDEFSWDGDFDLHMPSPKDNIYPLYLVAQIDFYNQETTMYANDMQMFNYAYADAKAWYRRNNNPMSDKVWKVMK